MSLSAATAGAEPRSASRTRDERPDYSILYDISSYMLCGVSSVVCRWCGTGVGSNSQFIFIDVAYAQLGNDVAFCVWWIIKV